MLASLLLLAAGCATAPPPPALLAGDWGGQHIGLRLTATGGRLEYDCAHGTIGPLDVKPGGRFTAEGTHTPERGGPSLVSEVLPSYRIRYSGTVSGNRMTLRGDIETGVELGPFELRRGVPPILFRCL